MSILRFNKKEEAQYKLDSFNNDLFYIRLAYIVCIFFYSIFGIVDFFVDIPNPWLSIIIRFAILNPLFILSFILSFHKSFFKYHQYLITIVYVAAGLGIIAMLSIAPLNYSYYCGLFLIFAVGHLLTKMRLMYVSIGSLIIILAYILACILFINKENPESFIYLIFYISIYVLNVFGSYNATKYKREKYNQVFLLRDDKVLLEKENYNKLLEIEDANRITTLSLAKLAEARDKYTGDHIERVGTLCLKLAINLSDEIYKKNNVEKEDLVKSIELSSTLHDIGKICIPENILMKPGKLTDIEMETMKTHSIRGYDMLKDIYIKYKKNMFINMGMDICKHHHENWDGSGYPSGLSSNQIPLSARIVSIIDVYDALSHKRPYKEAFPLEETLAIIKSGRNTRFDPDIVDAFLKFF